LAAKFQGFAQNALCSRAKTCSALLSSLLSKTFETKVILQEEVGRLIMLKYQVPFFVIEKY
jgi:hypothetical protein